MEIVIYGILEVLVQWTFVTIIISIHVIKNQEIFKQKAVSRLKHIYFQKEKIGT